MRLFIIAPGVEARAVRSGQDWLPPNIRHITTRRESTFQREQIVVDPVGQLGTNRTHVRTVGGDYARNGWYGFEADGWVLLIHRSHVRVL